MSLFGILVTLSDQFFVSIILARRSITSTCFWKISWSSTSVEDEVLFLWLFLCYVNWFTIVAFISFLTDIGDLGVYITIVWRWSSCTNELSIWLLVSDWFRDIYAASILVNASFVKSDFGYCERALKRWAFFSLDWEVKEDQHTLRDLLFFLHVPRTGGHTYFHW